MHTNTCDKVIDLFVAFIVVGDLYPRSNTTNGAKTPQDNLLETTTTRLVKDGLKGYNKISGRGLDLARRRLLGFVFVVNTQ